MNLDERIEAKFKSTYKDWEAAARSGDSLGTRQVLINNLVADSKQLIREVLGELGELMQASLHDTRFQNGEMTRLEVMDQLEAKAKEL